MKNVISEKLSILNQAHILKHIKELPESEQEELIEQIESLDFSVLDETGADEKRGRIEPLYATTLSEIDKNRDKNLLSAHIIKMNEEYVEFTHDRLAESIIINKKGVAIAATPS